LITLPLELPSGALQLLSYSMGANPFMGDGDSTNYAYMMNTRIYGNTICIKATRLAYINSGTNPFLEEKTQDEFFRVYVITFAP
jgi:hypothetical protein